MALGKKYMDRGEIKQASIEYRVASQNMPQDAEPEYQLGMVYLKSGSPQLAARAFEKAASLNPNHAGAIYQAALFHIGSPKPADVGKARETLASRTETTPNEGEPMGALALADAKLGDTPSALRHLTAFAQKESRLPLKEVDLRTAELLIASYLAKGEAVVARQCADIMVTGMPRSAEAALLKARFLMGMEDMPGARTEIERALTLRPDYSDALELRLATIPIGTDRLVVEETARKLSRQAEPRFWASYARLLFNENKVEEGIAEFRHLLKEHDDAASLRGEFVVALGTAGRVGEAESLIAETLKKYPQDGTALLQQTIASIEKHDFDAAAANIGKLRSMKVESAEISFAESRIYAGLGERKRQGDLLADALRQNPRYLQARLTLAQLLVESRNARNALSLLDQATKGERATADYVFARNSALIGAGDLDEARKGVDAGLAIRKLPGFLYQDAYLHLAKNDAPGARHSIETALERSPADAFGWAMLATAMAKQNQTPQYIVRLRQAAAAYPNSVQLQGLLANKLLVAGDEKGARAVLEASRSHGGRAEADPVLATLEIREGMLDAARARLTELVKTRDTSQNRQLLADLELKKGNRDGAIGHYLQAVRIDSENAGAMNSLAMTLASKGNYVDALFWGQKAMALVPGNPSVEDTLGWIYYGQGKFGTAMDFLTKSAKAANQPSAHYHLAATLMKTGDAPHAKREFDIAVRQSPSAPERLEVAALFEPSR